MDALLTVGHRYKPRYEGGHPSIQGPCKGDFVVTKEMLGIAQPRHEAKWFAACEVSSIERIEIGHGQVDKHGDVMSFGIFGLAPKERTDLLVHLMDGYAAFFTIEAPVPMVKAYLAPVLRQLQIPFEVE